MVIFTLMFAGLMLLSAQSRRRFVAISLIGCVAVLVVAPAPAPVRVEITPLRVAIVDPTEAMRADWAQTGMDIEAALARTQSYWGIRFSVRS